MGLKPSAKAFQEDENISMYDHCNDITDIDSHT